MVWQGGFVIPVFCLPIRMDNLNFTKTGIEDFCCRFSHVTRTLFMVNAHELHYNFSFSFFVAHGVAL